MLVAEGLCRDCSDTNLGARDAADFGAWETFLLGCVPVVLPDPVV